MMCGRGFRGAIAVVAGAALVSCGSGDEVTIEGEGTRVIVVPEPGGDGHDIAAEAEIALDPATGCLVTQDGLPLALPGGTTVVGQGEGVVVESGEVRARVGDEISGRGRELSRTELERAYGELPTGCGEPPWLVIDSDLRAGGVPG